MRIKLTQKTSEQEIQKPRKVIGSTVRRSMPENLYKTLNIRDFCQKKNKILIIRGIGGLGDIFMHRMMFYDFKQLMPEAEIHFACPTQYHDALTDHPYLDKILNHETVDRSNYIIHYNTTSACGRYELRLAPLSGDHRSDIWASHCGLKLTNHDMHIKLNENELNFGIRTLSNINVDKKRVAIVSPISSMNNKNLLPFQLKWLTDALYERNFCVIGLHDCKMKYFEENKIPQIYGTTIREWMSVIHASDCVVSVDTSTFHCAGGMKKPLLGIFTFVDGFVYSKHFKTSIIVQKHRNLDPDWTCGPCYNWGACTKTKDSPKPCLTEISQTMILKGLDEMIKRFLDKSSCFLPIL